MNKPTPGPWVYERCGFQDNQNPDGQDFRIRGHESIIGRIWWGSIVPEKAESNAVLIIAAVNACFAINPDNPLAVAKALPELVDACRFSVRNSLANSITSRHRIEDALAKLESIE